MHGTCIGKRNGVRSARQVQVRAVRIGGAYSGSRDPRQHGARARGASECRRHVQLQRAPATCAPQWSSIVRIFNRREETQALERKNTGKKPLNEKIPVRCRRCRRCRRHPKLGNVPTQIVHRMHAAFDCCTQAQHMSKDTGLRGEPGHSWDKWVDKHGRTRAHGSHRRTSQPSQPTNAPTRTTTETAAAAAAPFTVQTAVLVPEVSLFRNTRHAKDARKVDASERCIERSSRTMTRQKALMAL